MKSTVVGILLALVTAIGCIAYEKCVKNYSFVSMMLLRAVGLSLSIATAGLFYKSDVIADVSALCADRKYLVWAGVFVLSDLTAVMWYYITRVKSVLVGGTYEGTFLGMLALLYVLFGDRKMSLNLCVGVVLAVCSIFFVSRA